DSDSDSSNVSMVPLWQTKSTSDKLRVRIVRQTKPPEMENDILEPRLDDSDAAVSISTNQALDSILTHEETLGNGVSAKRKGVPPVSGSDRSLQEHELPPNW